MTTANVVGLVTAGVIVYAPIGFVVGAYCWRRRCTCSEAREGGFAWCNCLAGFDGPIAGIFWPITLVAFGVVKLVWYLVLVWWRLLFRHAAALGERLGRRAREDA